MGSKNQTSTTNSNQSYTPAGLSNLQDIYARAAQAASTPYQPYTGQLTAGLTDTQQNAISGANTAANLAQPYYQQAGQLASSASNPLTAAQIQQYMNPYTQSVINATQANFNEDNGVQQQQVKGNAAMQGALGGDRQAVAQSELARQQQLAQAPVIAGLQQQGYTQALQTAQQQFQQNPLAAAAALGNVGTGAQNAALQGVQGQLTAGGVQQQTNQTGLTNDYQQYLNALAYPYQNAQFLAGIGIPASGAMGGTTSGNSQTTQPGPNPFVQIAGLGLSAAGLFSDKRVKDDIQPIGKTFDGQKIYRFRYKNDPVMRVGLMAQDVEKENPGAVGKRDGIKTVDYEAATDDAADKGHFASGGAVVASPFQNIAPIDFINDARSYVPKAATIASASPSASQTQPSSASGSPFKPVDSLAPITSGLNSLKGTFAGTPDYGQTSNVNIGGYSMPMFGNIAGGAGTTSSPMGIGSLYADGGAVDSLADRFAPVQAAIADGTFDPQGLNYTPFTAPVLDAGTPTATSVPQVPVVADATPIVPSAPDDNVPLPPQIVGPQDNAPLPDNAMAYSGDGTSPMAMPPAGSPAAATPTSGQTMGGWNPFNLSDKARQAIIAGGLGIAASRSPFALSAIGEGGLQGMKTYSDLSKAEQDAADKRISQTQNQARIDQEAKRIANQAAQFAVTSSETARHNKAGEDKTPAGYRQKSDGSYEAIPGGPADPEVIGRQQEAKGKGPISDEDAKSIAYRYVKTGDRMQLAGLGYSGANRTKVNHYISEAQKDLGLSDEELGQRVAEFEGRKAAQRTLGTQEAKMGSAAFEAEGAIKQARGVIERLPRTNFLPFNKLIEGYQKQTLNPDQVELYGRTQAIVNTYAAVMARGANITTDSARGHAEALLNTAGNPETYNRMLDTMLAEINMAKNSPEKMRDFYRQQFGAKSVAPAGSATPSQTTISPAPVTKTINGKTYVKFGPNPGDWAPK